MKRVCLVTDMLCNRPECAGTVCAIETRHATGPSSVASAKEGWRCPVCNKGNAPAAMTCGHCAEQSRVTASTTFPSISMKTTNRGP